MNTNIFCVKFTNNALIKQISISILILCKLKLKNKLTYIRALFFYTS